MDSRKESQNYICYYYQLLKSTHLFEAFTANAILDVDIN